jgi:hypothetical protein
MLASITRANDSVVRERPQAALSRIDWVTPKCVTPTAPRTPDLNVHEKSARRRFVMGGADHFFLATTRIISRHCLA